MLIKIYSSRSKKIYSSRSKKIHIIGSLKDSYTLCGCKIVFGYEIISSADEKEICNLCLQIRNNMKGIKYVPGSLFDNIMIKKSHLGLEINRRKGKIRQK